MRCDWTVVSYDLYSRTLWYFVGEGTIMTKGWHVSNSPLLPSDIDLDFRANVCNFATSHIPQTSSIPSSEYLVQLVIFAFTGFFMFIICFSLISQYRPPDILSWLDACQLLSLCVNVVRSHRVYRIP